MDLSGWRFIVAVSVNFALGALMSVGIGNYAPCMVTLALLGMHPLAAFPIMMGSCALIQPMASLRFFETLRFGWGTCRGSVDRRRVGVLIAAYLVKSLPLETLRWLVTFVIAYAAFAMLRSAAHRCAGARLIRSSRARACATAQPPPAPAACGCWPGRSRRDRSRPSSARSTLASRSRCSIGYGERLVQLPMSSGCVPANWYCG
jgi:uncharacterized membrane protein YfcA